MLFLPLVEAGALVRLMECVQVRYAIEQGMSDHESNM
jgi:hypothetical protein